MIAYSYGGFTLHDNLNYFVDGIDLSWTQVSSALIKIARLPGMKKTGETVDDHKLTLTMYVLSPDGTRAGLRQKLDALYAALYNRQQKLILQDDNRYYIADCVNVQAPVKNPNYSQLTVDFQCYQPFALSLATLTDTFSGTLTGAGPYSGTNTVVSNGTVFAYPQIVVTNTGAVNITQLTVTNTTQNTGITSSALTLTPGDFATIQCDPGAANNLGYTITKNNVTSTLYDFNGTFPTQDVGTDTWTITCVAASAPTISAVWTWQDRYLA